MSSNAWRETDLWNQRNGVGAQVRYWTGTKRGPGENGYTRSVASVICGTAVVWITGHSGCVALSHVEPIRTAKAS